MALIGEIQDLKCTQSCHQQEILSENEQLKSQFLFLRQMQDIYAKYMNTQAYLKDVQSQVNNCRRDLQQKDQTLKQQLKEISQQFHLEKTQNQAAYKKQIKSLEQYHIQIDESLKEQKKLKLKINQTENELQMSINNLGTLSKKYGSNSQSHSNLNQSEQNCDISKERKNVHQTKQFYKKVSRNNSFSSPNITKQSLNQSAHSRDNSFNSSQRNLSKNNQSRSNNYLQQSNERKKSVQALPSPKYRPAINNQNSGRKFNQNSGRKGNSNQQSPANKNIGSQSFMNNKNRLNESSQSIQSLKSDRSYNNNSASKQRNGSLQKSPSAGLNRFQRQQQLLNQQKRSSSRQGSSAKKKPANSSFSRDYTQNSIVQNSTHNQKSSNNSNIGNIQVLNQEETFQLKRQNFTNLRNDEFQDNEPRQINQRVLDNHQQSISQSQQSLMKLSIDSFSQESFMQGVQNLENQNNESRLNQTQNSIACQNFSMLQSNKENIPIRIPQDNLKAQNFGNQSTENQFLDQQQISRYQIQKQQLQNSHQNEVNSSNYGINSQQQQNVMTMTSKPPLINHSLKNSQSNQSLQMSTMSQQNSNRQSFQSNQSQLHSSSQLNLSINSQTPSQHNLAQSQKNQSGFNVSDIDQRYNNLLSLLRSAKNQQ
eukprot:403366902